MGKRFLRWFDPERARLRGQYWFLKAEEARAEAHLDFEKASYGKVTAASQFALLQVRMSLLGNAIMQELVPALVKATRVMNDLIEKVGGLSRG